MKGFDIKEELKKLPSSPGVYLMHDEKDEIIYIGKAKNLKRRVSQYFQTTRARSAKIEKMISLIDYFEYIVTDSEIEALILENNLIKDHRPRYNTMLRDDKTYPYIKLTKSEEFPRLVITRRVKKDKDRYYGPYPAGANVKGVVELLQRAYKIRSCNRKLSADAGKQRPCLNYHIGRCNAPCAGYESAGEYAVSVENARRFLEGDSAGLISFAKQKMNEAAAQMEYEKAGEYRDILKSASEMANRQKMEEGATGNRDIIGLAHSGFDALVEIFFVRAGKITDRERFYLSTDAETPRGDILESFIKQYYSGTPFMPSEIYIPDEIEDKETVEEWLSQKAGRRVQVIVPQKGQKEKLVALAGENAKRAMEQDKERLKREEQRTKGAAETISKMLGINYARRIESYDISNTQGYESVGSMVVFTDGRPKKNDYRKFKIKTVEGPDDFASMAEVISRRFAHSEWERPDLLLIDGGKGQVSAVKEALKDKAADIPVCGMIKDDRHRTRGLIYEGREYEMDRSGEAFKLVTRIQDETHRFAIEYHRQLRSKGQVRSVLDDIEGIGPKRRLALMRHFKSLEAIREAGEDELANVPGMDKRAARAVVEFFEKK